MPAGGTPAAQWQNGGGAFSDRQPGQGRCGPGGTEHESDVRPAGDCWIGGHRSAAVSAQSIYFSASSNEFATTVTSK